MIVKRSRRITCSCYVRVQIFPPVYLDGKILTCVGDGAKSYIWPMSFGGWLREYLHQLQERQKWSNPPRNFAIGDVVLLVDDRIPRSSWPLGLVTEVHKKNKDNRVRRVSLKTQTTILDRPIDKIVSGDVSRYVTCSRLLLMWKRFIVYKKKAQSNVEQWMLWPIQGHQNFHL